MAFKFYIDGQLTDMPVNDRALLTSISRDKLLGGLVITQDVKLVYQGNNNLGTGEISGYSYIKSLYENDVCNRMAIEIYNQLSETETILEFKGIINVTQVEFDAERATVTCKIQDNGFYSYINNNKTLKVNMAGVNTKDGSTLTPINKYSIDMFNSNGCVYGSTVGFEYHGYRVTDVFRFIIAAISDNVLSFQSDYLDSLDPGLFITKGQDLINPYTIFPNAEAPVYELSLSDLFNEIDKCKNLIFYIDDSDVNNPVFRVENYEAAYQAGIIYSFDDLLELSHKANTEYLFGSILVGSDEVTDGQSAFYTWDSGRSYYGWRQEVFFPQGQCNTNVELNLLSQFILDNNVIQDILITQNTEWIDRYFLIECTNIDEINLTTEAYQWEYFGDGGCYYNLGLNNYNKLQRHSVKFESQFGNFLGIGTDGFRALLGSDPSNILSYVTAPASASNFIPLGGLIVTPAAYPNETTDGGYDGNGNYDSLNFEYVVPVTGDYSFAHVMSMEFSGILSQEYFKITNAITQYDAGLNIISQSSVALDFGGGIGTHSNTLVINANAGDIIKASYRLQYFPNGVGSQQIPRTVTLLPNSYFECNGTPEGGAQAATGALIKKYLYTFQGQIKPYDWQTIKANATKQIEFIKDNVTRLGWIESMKRNDDTGDTEIILSTSYGTTT